MRSTLSCGILAFAVLTVLFAPGPLVPGLLADGFLADGLLAPSGAEAASAVGECQPQSPGERPSLTSDDIVNCVVERISPTRIRVSVTYTYASPLGNRNIWLGMDVLAGGNRLKWFGYRPAQITSSSGVATVEMNYGHNDPPRGKLSTDQVEFFMYVGGGQIFYRKMFTLKHDWQL